MMRHSNKVYLMGSLRNPKLPGVGVELRAQGYDVFDDWFGAGPEADDKWQEYEAQRGRAYADALYGPAAENVFLFDKRNLDSSDMAVMVLPAGKSAHLELGYMLGQGKPGFIYFSEGEPERWDVMYQFATGVAFDMEQLISIMP